MVNNFKFFKGICVLDMGRVITKPANIKRFHFESNARCTLEEFKKSFYDSEQSKASYRGNMIDDEFFDFIREVSGSNMTSQQLQELYYNCKGGIYKETIELIERLKSEGYEVDLLSNLRPIDYEWLSKKMKLSLFDKMFLSYQLKMCKPDEEIFKHVINVLGINDFTFIDDSSKNIETAIEAGITNPIQSTGENITKILRL